MQNICKISIPRMDFSKRWQLTYYIIYPQKKQSFTQKKHIFNEIRRQNRKNRKRKTFSETMWSSRHGVLRNNFNENC